MRERGTAAVVSVGRGGARLWVTFAVALVVTTAVLVAQAERVPDRIALGATRERWGDLVVTGVAADLVPLAYVPGKGLWAASGYDLYFLDAGQRSLRWRARLHVTGVGALGYSRIVRRVANLPELVELRQLPDGSAIAFAGGAIHRALPGTDRFERVGKIDHFGVREGRGVMPFGVTVSTANQAIYWGEYWRNREHGAVRVWASADLGAHWTKAVEFGPGEVQHVHAVQFDPYRNAVWVGTGDSDTQSKVGYVDAATGRFQLVGTGTQQWRAVSFMFTPCCVYWGMDGEEPGHPFSVVRWDRATGRLSDVAALTGPAFYSAVSGDRLVLSTAAEFGDDALLHVSALGGNDEERWAVAARWRRAAKGRHGTVRLVAGDGGELYLGMVNVEPGRNSLASAFLAEPGR